MTIRTSGQGEVSGKGTVAGAAVVLALATTLVALILPATAPASDGTLRATLVRTSRVIGIDAHSLRLSATRRHPRRLGFSARRFRAAALTARRAVLAERPSSARGRRARARALGAFAQYAQAGREWSLSSRSRLQRRLPIAARHARIAASHGRRGNRLLIAAARLLR